jgi:malonyl-CoA reductase/3-hydroxypropionate dehydrogenase (NADP+)
MMSTTTRSGRLAGKIALITGGAGNIGEVMTRRYLAEGATVVITGRNVQKLNDYRQRLIDGEGVAPERVLALQMDGSDMAQVRAGIAEALERLGRIDILVNNAGTAGPRRPLAAIPLSPEELQAPDTETLSQAVGNLLGISWNVTRAATPHMPPGSSIINVSTIFSRTDYYGRIAYVVPKAALNALSQELAQELGAHGIRLNTIYPGPIDSERIRTVFKAMDGLKGMPEGSTANGFFDIMRLSRPDVEGELAKGFPKPLDVANAAVFLGSDESAAFSGHVLEVTNGMAVPAESRTTFASRPGLRAVDASGRVVLICAGDQVEDALTIADMLRSCRATVAVSFRDCAALARAEQLRAARTETSDVYGRPTNSTPLTLLHLDPLDAAGTMAALTRIRTTIGGPHDAIILPASGVIAPHGATDIHSADDTAVAAFLETEITGVIALSTLLERFWKHAPQRKIPPRVLFVSNPDDGRGNRFANILRAGIEQLARVWRHESAVSSQQSAVSKQETQETPASADQQRATGIWTNQLIRYVNNEVANLDFACAWITKIIASSRRIEEINLYLPERIIATTGVHSTSFGWAESLFGLHLGKVALITGGSAGIGGQVGRLLAMSGAKVMLAARGAEQLEQMRESIVQELREAGYPRADERVQIYDGADVSQPEHLAQLTEHTLAMFGRVDYLINNAGIAGAEEMVMDMPLDGWRHTLEANLISNYRLIRRLAPLMKANGSGYILNVSSYFGGEKYVAIPYPNRSDYAVSKAGQRAMAEALARFLGPEIQINALAPGPVEGDRLRGSGARPGLFMRRGRLILENKRLNELFAALIESHRVTSRPISDMLPLLRSNDVQAIMQPDSGAPEPLRQLANTIWTQSDPEGASCAYLMNETITRRLIRRLEVGGYVPSDFGFSIADFGLGSAAEVQNPVQPFFTQAQIEREAVKVRDGVLGMLYLQKMPTEFDVALATVYYLADRNITGETFHPSGGLKLERTVTEGELFGKGSPQRLEKLRGDTVFLIGEHMPRHLTSLAHTYLEEYDVGRVVFLTETDAGAEELCAMLPQYRNQGKVVALATHGDIEAGIDRARAEFGSPGPIISTPFRTLPVRALVSTDGNWSGVLSEDEFAVFVEQQLTHHMRVAQKASLIDGARLVLVTPETTAKSTLEEFALANFIKTTLHALTATLGAESERTVPHVAVNQVDLTRRARSEEPRNAEEDQEELQRFVQAVLLVSAPLPTPKDSRYRARIYRGNAITV